MFLAVDDQKAPLERVLSAASPDDRAGPVWRERIDKDDGVDAQALRVPWPDLASRSVLTALLQVKEKELWESTTVTTVIETVWSKKFKRIHMTRSRARSKRSRAR